MSVLTNVEALPNRITAVAQYVAAAPDRRISRDRLRDAVSPPTVRKLPDGRDSGMFEQILQPLVECNFLEGDDEISLAPALRAQLGTRELTKDRLRWLLFDLTTAAPPHANEPFAAAMAWYLAQDPADFDGRWDPESQRGRRTGLLTLLSSQGVEDRFTLNEERSENLRYWLSWFGLGWGHVQPEVCLPDPTEFIARCLAEPERCRQLLPGGRGEPHALSEFLDRLAVMCPVLDGGLWYRHVANRARLPEWPERYTLPALSLALRRLDRRGLLNLVHRSDAPQVAIMALAGDTVPVSHVRMPRRAAEG